MRALLPVCLAALLLTAPAPRAQDSSGEPVESDLREEVTVTLVQVDALAMDKKGQTVSDLSREDFELRLGGKRLEIGTFDLTCPIGEAADPLPVSRERGVPPPMAPGTRRRVVFAFDYYFMQHTMRTELLEAASAMLRMSKTAEEEVMIVALAWGARVEQRFTSNLDLLLQTLQRMEHDASLYAFDYSLGATGKSYFDDMTALMDVLAGYEGSKAVVLFSQAGRIGSATRDLWYNDVAMHAAAARTAIYPAHPDLLMRSGGDSYSLVRFANQTGGRMPFFTGDLSIPYRRAQRDLSCRYTVGAYLDEGESRKQRAISLSVKKQGVELRHPELMRTYSDEERKQRATRAAFIDPGPYETPLVRLQAFPAHPATAKRWDTLVTLHFPMPVGEGGGEVDVKAQLQRDGEKADKYERRFRVDPPEGGGETRPVTLIGDSKLQEGVHKLAVVLSRPEGPEIVSAEARFRVPAVPSDQLVVRGPLLARVVPGGLLLRADPEDRPKDTKLDEILGEDAAFEPLVVHRIGADEELLVYWNACVQGKLRLTGEAVVNRRFRTETGEVAHTLEPIPLELESLGKKLSCHDELEKLPVGTLAPGEYELDVVVTYGNGDLIAQSSAPLLVR
jgi:VWFA-related protein